MLYRRRWICSMCYILISISAILLTGCRKNGGTLTVGVRSDISEWSFCDPEKEIYLGLEEDIAELIQEKAGFQNIHYVAVSDSGDAEKKLAAGEIDCIIYDIAKNDTSSQEFLYSESYLLVVLLRLVAAAGRELVHTVDGAGFFFGDAGL